MDHADLVDGIFEDLRNDRLESAVTGCLRLARNLKDHVSAAMFLQELGLPRNQVARTIVDDAPHLTKEAHEYLRKNSLERWLDVHDLKFSIADDPEKTVLDVSAGELQGEIDLWDKAASELAVPAGLSPFDLAAFTDSMTRERASIRLRVRALLMVKARLKARCSNYAMQIERQLRQQEGSQRFLDEVQTSVNNYFRTRNESIYAKLEKACALAASSGREDASLLLTEVRRVLKATADHFYPPVGVVTCSDGKLRELGEDQYMNRLQEFMSSRISRSSARELLQAELDQLSIFSRKLNHVASKGVHADVSFEEAKQGLVGTYFFLFNLTERMATPELKGDPA